jgi:hypothetical protein
MRRHELLRNSDRLDRLRNAGDYSYSRGPPDYSDIRKHEELDIGSRRRDYLGSTQKEDRLRDTAETFPLKN